MEELGMGYRGDEVEIRENPMEEVLMHMQEVKEEIAVKEEFYNNQYWQVSDICADLETLMLDY